MEIRALPHWRTLDFISDLHLQAECPATFHAWQTYLQHTSADALFILGDWFEVWVGDDMLDSGNTFEAHCTQLLLQAAQRMQIFILHGNRDFLLGQACMGACNATLITDPCVLVTPHQRYLLTHGDALCTDDTAYMQFRSVVRTEKWQDQFLSQPLAQRQDIARQLRQQSETRKQSGAEYADVNNGLALEWLQSHQAHIMIHGHTHKPAQHLLDVQHERWVLSDWDMDSAKRAEVLRMTIPAQTERTANNLAEDNLQRLSLDTIV